MKIIKKYIILFLIVLVGTILLFLHHRTYERNYYDLLKDKMKYQLVEEESTDDINLSVDFSFLESVNSDIYSWIYIPNTDISYPVLQSSEDKDDNYYLKHNLDGSYGYPGVIFSQKRNATDYTDPVTVLYGHNMKNGSMFAGLHQYKDSEYFDGHKDIYIYTPTGKMHYKVFASLTYDDRLILSYYNDFQNIADLMTFYEESMEMADNKDYSVSVNEESNILVLSTCEKEDDQRYLIEAVLVED